ncbi:hypothetical protein B0T21DRAFT_413719 [Apiosordaria backusii]|uniref:C2H2-type domain-containing protein n=1 Tax=Apiosordaria backusii TaxID=314023 RepID=A0AA40B2C9_9PEZI|nr:hypothetical protein B0T21DRAFT_413719 [Apiosordaria backusii]
MPVQSKPTQRLVCLFFLFDPCHYFECACYDLKDYEAYKKHVQRRHLLNIHCPRCFESFDSEDAKTEHIRSNTCTLVAGHDKLTESEWAARQDCPRTRSCIEKCQWFWERYFNCPAPDPERFYSQGPVIEIARALIDHNTIQSTLEERLPLEYQNMSKDLAEVIGAALMSRIPGPGGPRKYRVTVGCNQGGSNSNKGPSVDLGTPSGLQFTGTQAVETELADPEAELLRPTANHVAQPLPQQVLLGQQDAGSPIIGGPSTHPATASSAAPSLQPGCSFNPASVLPQYAESVIDGPSTKNVITYRDVWVAPWGTADEVLGRLLSYPISWSKPDGPKWSDVYDYIDRDTLWQSWNSGSIPTVLIPVPIRETHVQSFVEMESKLHDLEGTGEFH